MPLPIMTDKEDIDAITNYLKKKPTGATVEEAKATISSKLVDGRKMSAYRVWGFINDKGDKITLAPRGREYLQASEDEKKNIYAGILNEEKVYRLTLEWIHNRNYDQVPASDVASHWYSHFRTEVGTDTEQSLTNQVTCFMGIVEAAGLGEYRIGRKGQPTRLGVNKTALQGFIEKEHDASQHTPTINKIPEISEKEEKPTSMPVAEPVVHSKPYEAPRGPALHIDIQIHIDSDASPEQIDKIFESMAKHLYNSKTD